MELQEKIAKLERVSSRAMVAGGKILASLTIFTLSLFGFAKLVKYLVQTW